MGQLFGGENKLYEMGKIGVFFCLFVVLFERFCLLLWVVVDGCLLVVGCFRNWDAEIRRRNLHEAFGRKLMQNRLGENYSRNFGPILVKLASNKQTKLDRLGKLL